jgi:class 3 adenylate cyclase/multidrug efflux pump subunit AcrA (membrane-fusion protein)
VNETLQRARAALEEHAWREAYDGFASQLAGELAGEDLERLGEAAWWSAHPAESLDAFQRSYQAYLSEGNKRRAARAALRLALEYADRSETALWNGWERRAARLLADEGDCVEQGWLEIALVRSSFAKGLDEAMRHATAALEIATRFGDRDLEAFALVAQGGILVLQTQLEQGLPLLDEGTLAAVGGELAPFTAGSIYCLTLGICRAVADYRRAGEWTAAVARMCERQSITGFPGICRVQRAEIMRLRGELTEAEDEARIAQTELESFGRLPQAGAAAYEVGEIRLRLGDLDAAEQAFEVAHRLGHEPQPGIALLRLARGQVDAARSSMATALADAPDPFERFRLLPARVEIALAAYDLADARESAEELGVIASTFESPLVHAAANLALGAVLTFEGDASSAVAELRAAVRDWTEAEAPFETAKARRCLAIAYRLSGDEASAGLELHAAREIFERLRARLEIERCEELIRAGREGGAGRRVERTFMFTDIVGSTNLIETIGDAAWEDVLRWHDEMLRRQIASHRGRVVHSTGDGFFASFDETSDGVACAVAIQRRLSEHRHRNGFAPQVRIGLHAAEATEIADDYAGIGVHEAARVGAVAEGGEILVTVSSMGRDGFAFGVGDEREVALKGIAQPVRVAPVEWRTDA